MKWEVVINGETYLMRVPGGTIYRYVSHQGVAMVFVPTPTFSPNIPYGTPGQGSPNYVHH